MTGGAGDSHPASPWERRAGLFDSAAMRITLDRELSQKRDQGFAVEPLARRFPALGDDPRELLRFAEELSRAPLRDDWEFVEPDDLPGILAQCDPARPRGVIRPLAISEAERKIGAAFLSRLCGCMLGKPVEGCGDYQRLKEAGERVGEWPLSDYVSEAFLQALGERHSSWTETVRERLVAAAPDDDINYTILAMMVLEGRGLAFTRDHLRKAWLLNLPLGWTWGPERAFLTKAGAASLAASGEEAPVSDETLEQWVTALNPDVECCGAAIRADAYGYACPGDPAKAVELAWRDAGLTHRRTGIYGSLFFAAAIAVAPVARNPLEIFSTALQFVPRKSRFHRIVADCLSMVDSSPEWLSAYQAIHAMYARYGFCQLYQECGTLINSVRFAHDVADGICIQVSQGNDTDSFGATAGSILGAWLGPDALPERWVRPLRNRIHSTVATFHEQDLDKVVQRMSRLPRLTLGPPR